MVAADSRFSKIRSKMSIPAFIRDFNKDMIVCRMKHEKSHKNIAYEFFRYNQTQATLPYIKNQSGIVTTADKNLTSDLMKMNKRKFKNQNSVKWYCNNAEKLPFKDNEFDYYTISFGLNQMVFRVNLIIF